MSDAKEFLDFFDCHVIFYLFYLLFFWQILKCFLGFKPKENFSYAWEHSGTKYENVNKFFVKISVDF